MTQGWPLAAIEVVSTGQPGLQRTPQHPQRYKLTLIGANLDLHWTCTGLTDFLFTNHPPSPISSLTRFMEI